METMLLEHRKQHTEPEFPGLPEMPAARYTDPRLYDLEQKHIFAKQWLYAGESSQLPEVGSYMEWNKAGVPVLLVRGKDQKIRAFYNTCRHRGTQLVPPGERGMKKVFACNFHGWTYDLDGALKFVTAEHEFPGLDKSTHGLKPLRCEMLGNLIFVNRDMNAQPLVEHLGKAGRELAHFDFEKRHYVKSMSYDLPCNWKVAFDAFAEVYHFAYTHKNTVDHIFDSDECVFRMWPDGHSIMLMPNRIEGREKWFTDAASKDPRHELTRAGQLSATIFPNISLALGEFIFPLINFWPTSISTTNFELVLTVPSEVNDEARAQADMSIDQLKVILPEDIGNLMSIQKSLEAGTVQSIPFGSMERRIYQWHEEIDRQIGIEKIPPELRMKQVTAPYIET